MSRVAYSSHTKPTRQNNKKCIIYIVEDMSMIPPDVIFIRINGKISFQVNASTKQLLWFYLKKNVNLISGHVYLFVSVTRKLMI